MYMYVCMRIESSHMPIRQLQIRILSSCICICSCDCEQSSINRYDVYDKAKKTSEF